ncbi:MAG: DNA-3-methyladenine glycosylase I [Candidatus Marinimicrobia bacterium]|jgi:DNA-3-methyladenine glycosylase I|nr:DNA-3-methyladenine glycosylase I [Candidatus Neomarinimicrobiota bacterium]MBT3618765.1 DNA-3-methyladenine glycosylase I [Candidatus Neomarinimicrobiota bacterium]MBT3828332.1 DNA-3-methyladenine glycosylase I [Candidatus Neomarinimicrobiota bacterium]MBT3997207.1 DNA-3-methyladenine glycosylase I [Candidatus Neomarinimicrobiota bacterium]MBT4280195.1 DNA-3-methyladenine glycosylase I [Candidatus Neomarinimicrobiota bacterium]
MIRCPWPNTNPTMVKYHDEEWGVPLFDDLKLFEFIVLDGFQAGLSWAIILNKRETMRSAFDEFNPEIIAEYSKSKIKFLLQDSGIIRNKLKVRATVTNARSFLEIQNHHRSFSDYIWQFTDHKTIINEWANESQIPTSTDESDAMSNQLKKDGFKFVGTTICYAFMQAAGMVNDHLTSCFRFKQISNSIQHP